MKTIKDIEEILNKSYNNIRLVSEEYINSKTKLLFYCEIHKIEFNYTLRCLVKSKKPCPFCNSKINNAIIPKLMEIHNNKYEYFEIESRNIKIRCKKHGIFEQDIYSHLKGNGCSKCSGYNKDTKDIIIEFKEIHGDRYDYSKVVYESATSFVTIICEVHGEFKQRPNNHLSGQICKKCSTNVPKLDSVINKLNYIHNSKYDYSKLKFKNRQSLIDIICKEHGEFSIKLSYHLSGTGCAKCVHDKLRSNTDEFIKKSMDKHLDMYDYSLVDYKRNKNKVSIICRKHGEFSQRPNDHLKGSGCPICKSSKGEIKILNFLDDNKIKYVTQYKFKDCRNKLPLPFDFYLPELNTCIEYDGILHFKSIDIFGGEYALENTINNDKIKTQYCLDNNINLIRIAYTEFNKIEKKLNLLILNTIIKV